MSKVPFLRALGRELRLQRKAMGLSQEGLAEGAGLHRNFVGLLERGERNPTILTLRSLTTVLQMSVSSLLLQVEMKQPRRMATKN